MNQPPGIGSWGLGLGFSLSVGDATRGVAMPGKTSEPYDNMVAKEVGTYDDILRTCDDLDDLDEWVVATVTAKVRGRTIFDARGDFTCSSLYDDLKRLCGDKYGQGIDDVVYAISSQDHAIFSKFLSAKLALEAVESPLEDSTFTRSIMANETSTTKSEETTLSDDVDDASDVDAATRTTLTTTGTTTQFSDTGTTADDYGDPPSLNVVDEPESRTLFKYAPSDETQMPNSGELTLPRVMDPPLQSDDFTNHLLCSGTQRGTHTDCFHPTVGNEFDFDDPSDCNLGDGARRLTSDVDVDCLSTVNSSRFLDLNRLGKFQTISTDILRSLMNSITSHGQLTFRPLIFWKYSYFDATRPPGAAAA